MLLAAIPVGGHYFVDIVAGAVAGALAIASEKPVRYLRRGRKRPVPGPTAAA